jgi:Tol biopolymer transport system component
VVQAENRRPGSPSSPSIPAAPAHHSPAEGAEATPPVVSPTGSSIAFVRHTQNEGADIFLCDATGQGLRRLTFDDRGIRGIAWSRDGQDLLYSGHRVGGWRLWRVPAYGGSPRDLVISGKQAYYPAIGRNRLAYTDSPTVSAIWRATLSTADSVEERPLIRSTGREVNAVWSPDGTKIADVSDQSGSDENLRQRCQRPQSRADHAAQGRVSAACAGRPTPGQSSSTPRAITGRKSSPYPPRRE